MRSLEDRYRRLLAWYPRTHRHRYEEEMLAVLLAGARPGQRRPGLAESLDLMASGAWARVGRATFGLSDRRWRAAAGVVGVLLPVALALKNLRPVVYMYALELRVPWVYLGLTTETVVLASLWTLTAALALLGLRRTAAASAWASALTHNGFLVTRYLDDPVDVLYGVRTVAIGVTAAICLTVAGPLDRRFLRTRPGRAFGVAMLLTLGWFAVFPALGRAVDIGDGLRTVEPWLRTPTGFDPFTYLALNDMVAATFALAAVVVAAIGVKRLEPAIRRRFLATLAPAAALMWAIDQFYAGYASSSPRFTPPVLLVTGQWIALAAVPLLAFAIAAYVVHRRERTIELLALGRAAQRG
jgi:hypothetical protein